MGIHNQRLDLKEGERNSQGRENKMSLLWQRQNKRACGDQV
jgi:hypothetical protein